MMDKSMLEAAHETVKGLHDIGLVDQATMCEFDTECLSKVDKQTANAIKEARAGKDVVASKSNKIP